MLCESEKKSTFFAFRCYFMHAYTHSYTCYYAKPRSSIVRFLSFFFFFNSTATPRLAFSPLLKATLYHQSLRGEPVFFALRPVTCPHTAPCTKHALFVCLFVCTPCRIQALRKNTKFNLNRVCRRERKRAACFREEYQVAKKTFAHMVENNIKRNIYYYIM